LQIGLLGDEQFEHFVGAASARLVAVEDQYDSIGMGLHRRICDSPSAVPKTATALVNPY